MNPDLKETLRNVGIILLTSYLTISVALSFAAVEQHGQILDLKEQVQKKDEEIIRLKESVDFLIKNSQTK